MEGMPRDVEGNATRRGMRTTRCGMECHETWNGIPVLRVMKRHKTCHVHSDSRGLVAKHKEIHEIIALTLQTGKCSAL